MDLTRPCVSQGVENDGNTETITNSEISQADTSMANISKMNVDELRVALAESLQANNAAQIDHGTSLSISRPTTTALATYDGQTGGTDCLFLELLPREIRDQIYRLLLRTKLLKSSKLFSWGGDCYRNFIDEFGLSPAILHTCRQINTEASDILYGENRFLIVYPQEDNISCPLLRYIPWRYSYPKLFTENASFTKVKHWRIVLSTRKTDECYRLPNEWFNIFCRILIGSKPVSLEVSMQARGGRGEDDASDDGVSDNESPVSRENSHSRYHNVVQVLHPLRMLRAISSVKFGNVSSNDAKVYDWQMFETTIKPLQVPEALAQELKLLLQGNTPVRHIFKMNENLLAYSQTYERHEEFRKEMEPSFGLWRILLNQGDCDRVSDHPEYVSNPFVKAPLHPVERGLQYSSMGAEEDDIEVFLSARNDVLQYLEAQYCRIVRSARQVTEFVKEHKRGGDFFDAAQEPKPFDYFTGAKGMLLLESYAKSFVRDMPDYIKLKRRLMQQSFNSYYAAMQRDVCLTGMSHALDAMDHRRYKSEGFPLNFTNTFKLVVDDMDRQFFEIRRARKNLYDNDDIKYPDNIDLGLWMCDEPIDWTVNEPDLTPASAAAQV